MKTTFIQNWIVKISVVAMVAFVMTLAVHSPALEGVSSAVGQTSAPTAVTAQANKTRDHLIQMALELGNQENQASVDAAMLDKIKSIEPAAHSVAAQERYERAIANDPSDSIMPDQGFYRLHLASVADPDDVVRTIESLKTFGSPQLSGANFLALDSTVSDAGKLGEASEFTRIFAGEFPSRDTAQQACSILRSDGQYCSVLLVSQ